MNTICNACGKSVSTAERQVCTAPSCKQAYHFMCVNMSSRRSIKDWKCPVCVSAAPRGDNSNTPIKPKSVETGEDGDMARVSQDTMDKLRDSIIQAIRTELPSMLREVINKEMRSVKEELKEMKKSLSFLTAETSEMKREINNIKSASTENSNRCSDVESRLSKLECEHAKQEQWSRLQNLEIIGVPEDTTENLLDVVCGLARSVKVDLRPDEIEFAHRVQPLRAAAGRARSIVIRLRQRATKDRLLSAARGSRGLTASGIGLGGDNTKIYINEHLTPSNKQLLKTCKIKAKESSYKFIWTKNCRIFVRKDEKSPPIPVSCESDLKKIM